MSDPHAHAPAPAVDQKAAEAFSGKLFMYLLAAFAGFVGAALIYVMFGAV
jgi:hypothetical protein